MPPAKWQYKYKRKRQGKSSPQKKPSVRAVWEALQEKGSGTYTVRALAETTGYSVRAVHLALKTLAAQGVIKWRRAPKLGSTITILGGSSSGRNVYPQTPRSKNNAFSRSGLRPVPAKGQLGERANRWALAQIRDSLIERPAISPARRAVIMASLGPAVHRTVTRGLLQGPRELQRLVDFVIARLEERRGLGLDYGETRRWAEWCVRGALRAIEEDRERAEATAQFLREMERDREEVRRARAAAPKVARTVAQAKERAVTVSERGVLAELVPDLEERRRRYLAALSEEAPMTVERREPEEKRPVVSGPPQDNQVQTTRGPVDVKETVSVSAEVVPRSFLKWVKQKHPFHAELIWKSEVVHKKLLKEFQEECE